MDPDEPCCPLVDDFFEALGAERSRSTRARLVRARLILIQLLGAGPVDPPSVLRQIPLFVDDPCVPRSLAAGRAHLSVAGRLIKHLQAHGATEVDAATEAVQQARDRLERRAAEAGPDPLGDRIPARLLAHRGE